MSAKATIFAFHCKEQSIRVVFDKNIPEFVRHKQNVCNQTTRSVVKNWGLELGLITEVMS